MNSSLKEQSNSLIKAPPAGWSGVLFCVFTDMPGKIIYKKAKYIMILLIVYKIQGG